MSGAEASATNTAAHTADTPQLLLDHHLKELRLPTILREYDKVARQCAVEQVDYQHYLLRITELELLDRERRATERRIRQAKFPVVKTMESFDFLAIPSLNKTLVLELARCEFLARRENVLLLGNSGTGKTHIALALGLAACQRGHRVRFTTTAALVSELIEARDDKKLLRFQKQIASYAPLPCKIAAQRQKTSGGHRGTVFPANTPGLRCSSLDPIVSEVGTTQCRRDPAVVKSREARLRSRGPNGDLNHWL